MERAGFPSSSESTGRIIASAFPGLRGMAVEFLDEGWDFRVFEVGEKWIFRFSKHEKSVRKLEMEFVLLPELNFLREQADLPSPRIPGYERFIGTFGLLAMALAAVGLYGVIGYSVSRRTREIGIRVALGAESHRVLRLVVRQGMSLVLIGALIGTVLGAAAGQLLATVLYGVSPLDPIAFGGAVGLLLLIALLANYLPARRASRIDPMVALRSE